MSLIVRHAAASSVRADVSAVRGCEWLAADEFGVVFSNAESLEPEAGYPTAEGAARRMRDGLIADPGVSAILVARVEGSWRTRDGRSPQTAHRGLAGRSS